ncbi:LamG-like jellyroll fold domain-containing protein [Thermodesulfobacteriota bacterium]
MKRMRRILAILGLFLIIGSNALAQQVVTVYFGGTGLKSDAYDALNTSWGNPELLAELHQDDNSVPILQGPFDYLITGTWDPQHTTDIVGPHSHHKYFVNGVGTSPESNPALVVYEFIYNLIDTIDPNLGKRTWANIVDEARRAIEREVYNDHQEDIVLNLVGYSRGCISAMMTARAAESWPFVTKVNILVYDPVSGGFDPIFWFGNNFHLGPKVNQYVGLYAEHERTYQFEPVVPLSESPTTKMLMVRVPGSHETMAGNIQKDGHFLTLFQFNNPDIDPDLDNVKDHSRVIAEQLLTSDAWGNVPLSIDNSIGTDGVDTSAEYATLVSDMWAQDFSEMYLAFAPLWGTYDGPYSLVGRDHHLRIVVPWPTNYHPRLVFVAPFRHLPEWLWPPPWFFPNAEQVYYVDGLMQIATADTWDTIQYFAGSPDPDITAPVPDKANIDIIAECPFTISTPPTATDNRDGRIFGTPLNVTLPFTWDVFNMPGAISWQYTDSSANFTIQNQNLFIVDASPPIPDLEELPVIIGIDSVTIAAPPTASDCEGMIEGTTTDPLTYNAVGDYTITWSYMDGRGNVSTQIQTVKVSPDFDTDLIADLLDNCPDISNHDQGDFDGDGIGDACDVCNDQDGTGDCANSLSQAAYWDFDQDTGAVAIDTTNNSNDGTIVGAVRGAAFIDDGLSLNGAGDYVEIPSSTSLGIGPEGTIALWAKMADWNTTVDNELINNGIVYTADNSFYLSMHYSLGLHFRYGGISQTGNTILTYPEGKNWEADSWHHLAVTWKKVGTRTYLHLYADGKVVASTSTELAISLPSSAWNIGRYITDTHQEWFGGLIDEAGVWNSALTAEYMSGIGSKMLGYSFNEGTGSTALDVTDKGNDGAIIGAVRNSGKVGSGLSFDGGDSVEIPASTSLGIGAEGTIALWARMADWNPAVDNELINNGIVYTEDNAVYLSVHHVVGLHFRYGGASQAGNITATYAPSKYWATNSWHHIAVTWERVGGTTYLKLYADGKLVASNSSSLLIKLPSPAWNIGKYLSDTHQEWFNGRMDEVGMWNRALPAGYISRFAGEIAHWSFDKGVGSIAYDATKKGNDGTIIDAARDTGIIGNGLSFDGDGDYVEAMMGIPEYNFTIVAWAKTDSPGGIFSVANGDPLVSTTYDRHLYVNATGNPCFRVWNTAVYNYDAWCANTIVNDNQWHQWVLVTETGVGQKAYIDGELVGTDPIDHSTDQESNRVFIGYSRDIGFFNGKIDEVGIWDRALSAVDVSKTYTKMADIDFDGILNQADNCQAVFNPGQDDSDFDGLGDACDVCPDDAGNDADNDGLCYLVDPCPLDVDNDVDGDGVCGDVDICPLGDDNVDTDFDGVPDACDICQGGDDNVDTDNDGRPDACDEPIADIKVNGSDSPMSITTAEIITLTLFMAGNGLTGTDVDWWIVAGTPFGYLYYDTNLAKWRPGLIPSAQGPLTDQVPVIPETLSGLPPGHYTFFFGVDTLMNGSMNLPRMYLDSVKVTVSPTP